MNKPQWKDAPEWANWLAQDGDRDEPHWAWFEERPSVVKTGWLQPDGRYQETNTGTFNENWQQSLEPRP